jgi:ribulose-phosphate 3-epimerase
MIKIAPSILSADFGRLYEDVNTIERAGADILHIDVMDGHFVPNITIGPGVVKALRSNSKLVFDVHLMIENPDLYIPQFVEAGADIISVHAEACRHLHRTIQSIKDKGIKAAVALNPATPINQLDCILEDIDMILLMTVNPGFGGQSFIKSALRKISELRDLCDKRKPDMDIEVDGGINLSNLPLVVKAGANIIVAGSAIYNSPDVEAAVNEFRRVGEGI